jgi:hypothetical protein
MTDTRLVRTQLESNLKHLLDVYNSSKVKTSLACKFDINTPVKVMALVVFLRMGVSSSGDKVSESIN